MNREQLEKTIAQIWGKCDAGLGPRDIADFILANFDPKQETERVTAKEVYLALTANSASSHTRWRELIIMAQQGAEAFNNYKPEINEH